MEYQNSAHPRRVTSGLCFPMAAGFTKAIGGDVSDTDRGRSLSPMVMSTMVSESFNGPDGGGETLHFHPPTGISL